MLLVLLLYCVPALTALTILDLIPLQDPRKGWRDNLSFWVRFLASMSIISAAILMRAQLVVPDIPFTATRIFVIAVGAGAGSTASMMLLAELWMFPIPFIYTAIGLPFMLILSTLVAIAMGRTTSKQQLGKFFKFTSGLSVQTLMLVVYPGYNAIFLSLDGVAQLAFVLLLPMIKIALKFITAKTQPIDDDLIRAALSSVDIFDAVYMTKCMQSAGTLLVGLTIILVDLVQNYLAVRSLARRTRTLRSAYDAKKDTSCQEPEACLPLVFQLIQRSQHLDSATLRFGSDRFALSAQTRELLSRLSFSSKGASGALKGPPLRGVSVVPFDPSSGMTEAAPSVEMTNACIIKETVRLLHASESVAVVEYIEAIVPVMYAIYLAILFHLPNARYYQDMQGFTSEKFDIVATNILIYAALEVSSLVYVDRMMSRQFGISVVYQLAFTLENEWRIYQCCFLTWVIVVFQFLLVHSGTWSAFLDALRSELDG